MNKKIVLAALFATVAFFPLSTTSSHAASCAEELKVVEVKYNLTQDGEVRYRRGAEGHIVNAQKSLAANDEAKCQQQVSEARRDLRVIKEASDGDSGDSE